MAVLRRPQFLATWASPLGCLGVLKILQPAPHKSNGPNRARQDPQCLLWHSLRSAAIHTITPMYSIGFIAQPWFTVRGNYPRMRIPRGRCLWDCLGSWLPHTFNLCLIYFFKACSNCPSTVGASVLSIEWPHESRGSRTYGRAHGLWVLGLHFLLSLVRLGDHECWPSLSLGALILHWAQQLPCVVGRISGD